MTISIAVASGKGGVGKTSIAVNLSLTLSRLGSRVVLFDADFGLANSHILLGVNPTKTAQDILVSKTPVQEVLAPGPLGLKFLSGGSGLTELLNLEVKARYELIRTLDVIQESTDVLVVDVPAGASDSSITFSAAVDKLVLILVGEPTSFMDAYTFIKTAKLDYNLHNFSILVNMVENEKDAKETFDKFQNICGKFLNAHLTFAGGMPRTKRIQNAIIRKLPVVLDKEADFEKVAFQRLSKNIIKAGENKHNGIRFFSES